MEYAQHILILILLYATLGISLNLSSGYAGIVSICHAAFYGIGAYVVSLQALAIGYPLPVGIAGAIIVCGLIGAFVGISSLRIQGEHFVIATFALQVVVTSVLSNWVSFTGGPLGLSGIPQPVIFGWHVDSYPDFLILTGLYSGFVLFACRRIVASPFGRLLKSIREDEACVSAAGKDATAAKTLVFAVGAGIAGGTGGLYATYVTYIDPSSFTIMESIFILSIVIIGGAGSLWGPVVGAVVLVTMPELLRFVGMPSGVAANVRQILYGAALVACMMWRPQGIIGDFSFTRGKD